MSILFGFCIGFIIAGGGLTYLHSMHLRIIAEGIVNGWYCGDEWQKHVSKAIHEAVKSNAEELLNSSKTGGTIDL